MSIRRVAIAFLFPVVLSGCNRFLGADPLTEAQVAELQRLVSSEPIAPVDKFGYAVDTMDRRTFIRWVRAGAYDSLTAELAGRWQLVQQDIRNEGLLYNAYEAFYSSAPALDKHLAKWEAAQPGAVEPLFARAYYQYGRASAARGSATRDKTTAEQFEEMRAQIAAGRQALEAGMARSPSHLIGHLLRLNYMRLGGMDQQTAVRTVQEAVAAHPTSFMVRDDIMSMMQPRWGGSIEVMRAFAEASQEAAAANPKMAVLLGRVPIEEARMAEGDGMKLALLDQAAFHGEDYVLALAYGTVYHTNKQYVESIAAYRRARAFLPQGRTQMAESGVVMLRAATLAEEGALRDSLFQQAERALKFTREMAVPDEDPSYFLNLLYELRTYCAGRKAPCAPRVA